MIVDTDSYVFEWWVYRYYYFLTSCILHLSLLSSIDGGYVMIL